MIAIKNDEYFDKLKKRRADVARTLEHVKKEHRAVNENREWIDNAAYKRRCRLFDNLEEWYIDESARIEEALTRLDEGRYGVCVACSEPIEPHRLAAAPDEPFCGACHESRKASSLD